MNTEEKIKVMQAYEDGKKIRCLGSRVGEFHLFLKDLGLAEPVWNWDEVTYEIVPETVEEAANKYADSLSVSAQKTQRFGFIAGAKWQKEQ